MVDFDKEENVAEDILQIIEKDDFKKEEPPDPQTYPPRPQP